MEKKFAVFSLLDAFSFSGIVIIHSINDLLEGDELEGSVWFFVGLVDDEVKVVHKIDFLFLAQLLVEIKFRNEAKLGFKESAFWKFQVDGLVKDIILQFLDNVIFHHIIVFSF